MSTPPPGVAGAVQHVTADADTDDTAGIPRRLMRVKVLYTFDDQNKSNCLARLPNALNVPTVFLDETTQIGVIELKTCIQAIVSASPELVAKLGHDYTVYAYDFSEYETPLVGQGMLSWILASASATPNAPAEESKTMVTGRVCKNILGLFSNGVKETLEVKLKLVPVPTCMQSEYVENMERYHSLSKVMPEGMDYNAWAEFLKANPTIGELAQPSQSNPPPMVEPISMDSLNGMLMSDPFYDQHHMSFNTHDTRASSPAMSTASLYAYQMHPEFRPASQASFHSDTAAQSQYYLPAPEPSTEQQEDGPPKKRARVTRAKRPKKPALGANADSLRVTASTAASVRLHRPVALNAGAAVSMEQVPRAPTPRPRNAGMHQHGTRHSAPSQLRNDSTDQNRPHMTPYDSGIFSDTALESADDDKGGSPGDTPQNLPSSPPVLSERIVSETPSSPELPILPPPADSGFVSDIPVAQNEEENGLANGKESGLGNEKESRLGNEREFVLGDEKEMGFANEERSGVSNKEHSGVANKEHSGVAHNSWDKPDHSKEPEVRMRKRPDRSKRSWSEYNPGPADALPTSSASKHRSGYFNKQPKPTPLDPNLLNHFLQHTGMAQSRNQYQQNGETAGSLPDLRPTDTSPFNHLAHEHATCPSLQPDAAAQAFGNPSFPSASNAGTAGTVHNSLSVPKPARVLARSQTWSGEPMSDAAAPLNGKVNQPRSGSGAKRKQGEIIRDKLEQAIGNGNLPTFCNNCGEIETPAWRRAYTRVEDGTPEGIVLSSKGTAITAYQVIEQVDGGLPPQYRIFKQQLEPEEIEGDTFKTLTLCNPCGLWLRKQNTMRPREVWGKAQASADKPKKKKKPKKPKTADDPFTSDAIFPDSEPLVSDTPVERGIPSSLDGSVDSQAEASSLERSRSFQIAGDSQINESTARVALMRAIQSSPVGLRGGSRDTPIDLEADLTPKPMRRLLFPSPRRPGEVKTLADSGTSQPPSTRKSTPKIAKPPARLLDVDMEDVDKENCPPPDENEEDSLAHLFKENISPKATPTKGSSLEDLLKTPTPGSRHRVPLTPMRHHTEANLSTPSKSSRTPKANGRATTLAPETPFTRQLNDILSDCIVPGSSSQGFDLSDFPTFNTPSGNNKSALQFGDLLQPDLISSDLPIPSSPPKSFDFCVFEDPNTSTVGLWSGASIFDSDAIMSDAPGGEQRNHQEDGNAGSKIHAFTGISLDFAAMIEEVVGKQTTELPDAQLDVSGEREVTSSAEPCDAKPVVAVEPELNKSVEPVGSKTPEVEADAAPSVTAVSKEQNEEADVPVQSATVLARTPEVTNDSAVAETDSTRPTKKSEDARAATETPRTPDDMEQKPAPDIAAKTV